MGAWSCAAGELFHKSGKVCYHDRSNYGGGEKKGRKNAHEVGMEQ